ncbi:hypothetical protein [Actinomadura vinacea]
MISVTTGTCRSARTPSTTATAGSGAAISAYVAPMTTWSQT